MTITTSTKLQKNRFCWFFCNFVAFKHDRGLFKQTLQALARCAWINMRRLFLFDVKAANLALQKA